jgi:hypothetical protein
MLRVIYTECRSKPFMMNAVMLNVVMLSVVAPYKGLHTCRHLALPSNIRRGSYWHGQTHELLITAVNSVASGE